MGTEQKTGKEILLPKVYKSRRMHMSGIPAETVNGDEYMASNKNDRHQFQQGIDVIQPISNIGDVSAQTIKHELDSADENYYAGIQEERKYINPVMDIAAVVGARELSKNLKAELNQITITSGQVYDLIKNGNLSMLDLSDKKLLQMRLENIEGLTFFQKHQICRFRETAYDFIVLKDALEKRRNVIEKLEKPLHEHLKSKEFFDMQQQKTNELLKVYFRSSQNDVLKNVNSAEMSEKSIAKLLKTSQKNGFTETDISAIRLAKRQMKYRESRIRIGKILNIKRRIELFSAYSYRVDGNISAGIEQMAYSAQMIHGAYAVGKFGLKAGIVSVSFAAKYTGVSLVMQKVNQKRRESAEQLKEKTLDIVKNSKPYQNINKKADAVKNKALDVKEKLEEHSAVQKYKEVQANVKERAKSAGKKLNQTKAAARSAGRKIEQGRYIVLSPVRLFGKAVNSIRAFFDKIRLALFAGVGIVIVSFLIIIVLTNTVLTAFQTESNVVLAAILTENENFIAEMTSDLQMKADDKRADAESIISGTPQNISVLEGHTISKYGHPDESGNWAGGSKIIYLDGNGNVILNGMNNIKDCIVMAYVIMDGDFDTNETARNDLVTDLWELMNPQVTYEESDIYTCPYGCDTYSYCCDSVSDYTNMNTYKADGVGFYNEIKTYTIYGDSYSVTCDGCKDEEDETIYHTTQTGTGVAQPADGCENYTIEYQCSGHSATICYGHKDVEVYVTVQSMEEMFVSGEMPSGTEKTYRAYLDAFSGWTEDNQEWARMLYSSDWFDLYGIDPSGGSGYVAGSGMTSEEIEAILDTYGTLDATRTAICADAMSFVGQIPYYWGGKAVVKDYTANGFNTTITPDYKGRNKKGLDCSGFVQWIVWRVTDVKIGASTSTITEGMQTISTTELQPGDLGLMAVPGTALNHVGIFIGYNEQGQALWCHENSSAGNVSVNNTTCFRYYYRLF